MTDKTIGLALGGGGLRGLAHIVVLEKLDSMGIRPSLITGTSMGAIIGAIYASGIPGAEIRRRVLRHLVTKGDSLRSVFEKKRDLAKWLGVLSPETARGGLLKVDRFLGYLFDEIHADTFEKLEIPLTVIATDFWKASEVVFRTGLLLPAIKASIAVPGIFAPVELGERVLIDGGAVNKVPFDHLTGHCDISIAVDVRPQRSPGKHETPGLVESVMGAFEIMGATAMNEKLKNCRPDIYLRPGISGVRMFEMDKIERVLEQARGIGRELEVLLMRKLA